MPFSSSHANNHGRSLEVAFLDGVGRSNRTVGGILTDEHLPALLEHVSDVLAIMNEEGFVRYVSPPVERMLGFKPEQLLGSNAFELVHPDDLSKARNAFAEVLNKPGIPGPLLELRTKHHDGSWRVTEALGKCLPDDLGQLVLVLSLRDITSRKEAEKALERTESKRRAMEEQMQEQANLLDLAQDAILVCDLTNQITYWNKSAERVYGWTGQEMIGKRAPAFLFRENERFQAAQETLMKQGSWSGELTQVSRSGNEVIVSSRWTLVCDSQRRPKSILIINTDITEKKELQARFLRTQRVESIGVLTSGIAHDLNNILSPILMIVAMLRKEVKSPTAQARLDLLESNALHGVDVVRQILTFARGLKAEKEPIQTASLLQEFSRLVREIFPKEISFDFRIPDELWTIKGNATELHQVLLNLCINARDAMPQGGCLTVAAENVVLDEEAARSVPNAKPGSYVMWQIKDTGTGIAPENINRIFDPFFSTKGEENGTGLGLSIMLGIVSNHDGCVHVESEVNHGTDFKIYLPVMH